MDIYGVGVLPLIEDLKRHVPEVWQPWYADDSGGGGTFAAIRRFFERLCEKGPGRGYFPEPSKSVLVVAAHNVERAKAPFADLNFKVVMGSRYLGGFVGEAAAQASWVEDKASSWAEAVGELAVVAKRFPQTAYAGLQKSLQQEWQFVQRVTPGIGAAFAAIEASIRDRFLPALFGEEKAADPTVRTLASLPVKATGLALPDPTTSSAANYTASTVCCTHLVQMLRGHTPFRNADHVMVMCCAKQELRAVCNTADKQVLAAELAKLDPKTCRMVERARETGSWLSVTPTAVCGFELFQLRSSATACGFAMGCFRRSSRRSAMAVAPPSPSTTHLIACAVAWSSVVTTTLSASSPT